MYISVYVRTYDVVNVIYNLYLKPKWEIKVSCTLVVYGKILCGAPTKPILLFGSDQASPEVAQFHCWVYVKNYSVQF